LNNDKNSKINLVLKYLEKLKSAFSDNLVSVFLYGSVARRDDGVESDIDVMVIVKKQPGWHQLKKLGNIGRFNEVRGAGEFRDISCAVVFQDTFLDLAREGAPREAINPLREAAILYDTGFISKLKEELESGAISMKEDAYLEYIRFGNIRRSCLIESTQEGNWRDKRSDSLKAAMHYLRAYFLYRYEEMILPKEVLKVRVTKEDNLIGDIYEKIIKGTLANIADKISREKIGRQALIFVGDVLKKKDFKMSRLYAKSFAHSYRRKKK